MSWIKIYINYHDFWCESVEITKQHSVNIYEIVMNSVVVCMYFCFAKKFLKLCFENIYIVSITDKYIFSKSKYILLMYTNFPTRS